MENKPLRRTPSFKKPTTLLQCRLNHKQHVYSYYIIPIVLSCVVYILHFAGDLVLTYQHYRVGDTLYASLTLFFMFVPAIGSFFLTVINLNLWPEETSCGTTSVKWFFIRFFQHLLFPIWAMFRYAEQLFWRIEALRCDESERDELLTRSRRRSVFNLYHFLQAYFQAIPQILLQIHIILRHPSDFNKSTVDMQVMSIILSLIKIAMTTTSYQRFQSQKLAGREYPWDKIKQKRRKLGNIKEQIKEETNEESTKLTRQNSGLSVTSSQFEANIRKDKERYQVPMRIDSIRGLCEDDAAGKFVSMLWWFCFILPRVLTLSILSFFYPLETFLFCLAHYCITLILLIKYTHFTMPDTTDDVDKKFKCDCITSETIEKISYYVIISYIYIFCLIELKIRFTRVKRVYNCYFILVYVQNIVMMCVWYIYEEKLDEWWFTYVFYLSIVSSILSVLSMAMYLSTLKPPKRVVHQVYRDSKL